MRKTIVLDDSSTAVFCESEREQKTDDFWNQEQRSTAGQRPTVVPG
jgi:hypothetical protein